MSAEAQLMRRLLAVHRPQPVRPGREWINIPSGTLSPNERKNVVLNGLCILDRKRDRLRGPKKRASLAVAG
jgi:hypothetical protein